MVWLVANGLVRTGEDPRPDLHPQGGRRAGRPGPDPAAGAGPLRRSVARPLGRWPVSRLAPTTPTPPRCSASTACGSAIEPSRAAADRGRGLAARRRRGADAGTARCPASTIAGTHRRRRRARPGRGVRRAPGRPGAGPGGPGERLLERVLVAAGGGRRAACRASPAPTCPGVLPRLPARGPAAAAWSPATPRRKRESGACSTSATRWRWRPGLRPGRPGGRRGEREPVPASCCSTSTRTPATPRWCCCGRCSAAGTRSPRSATRTSRSTAGAAPRPATCSASRPTSRGRGGARPGSRYLSTSWRNDRAVLAVANAVAGRLRLPPPWSPRSPGGAAAARGTGAGAGRGPRGAGTPPSTTRPDAIAELVAARSGPPTRPGGRPLDRGAVPGTRAQFPLIEAALRARGLPVEVVGLGGLLHVPEVADVRAALEVLHDPTRGDSLMRLLTGPAWRIGAARPGGPRRLGRPAAGRPGGTAPGRARSTPPRRRRSWRRWTTCRRRTGIGPPGSS